MNSHVKLSPAIARTLVLIAGLVTLTACDGGLFGTGDGSDIVAVDASSPGIQIPTEQPPGSPGDEAMSPVSPVDSADTEALIPTLSFNNLLTGSDQTSPAIALLNVSSRTLNLNTEGAATALFEQDITPGLLSETASLAVGENFLDVIDNTEIAQTVFSIRPLNAGVATVTFLVARDLPERGLDIVPLRTTTRSSTPSVAQVRVVQANLLGDTDTPATFDLEPAGSMPGNAAVSFSNVAAATAAQASYQNVGVGTYNVVDSLNRFEPVAFSVLAGEIYTLVITDTTTPVLLIQTDTDLL